MLLDDYQYQVKGLRSFGSKREAPACGSATCARGARLRRVPRREGREGGESVRGVELLRVHSHVPVRLRRGAIAIRGVLFRASSSSFYVRSCVLRPFSQEEKHPPGTCKRTWGRYSGVLGARGVCWSRDTIPKPDGLRTARATANPNGDRAGIERRSGLSGECSRFVRGNSSVGF
jgi:hypothetical protein